jgi:Asp-tRNA(Asn)/Glu-tRNA(Gln) amidotransferase A subunit family amidase
VKDLAAALTVMASIGYDPSDNITSLRPSESFGINYSKDVFGGSLRGLRFGLLEGFFNRTSSNETTPVNNVMSQMISVLQNAGVDIVHITEAVYNATSIASLDVQTSEYREDMDSYLQMSSLGGSQPSTLGQLYSSGKFLVIPSQYGYVETALSSSTSNASYAPTKLAIQNLITVLSNTFSSNRLDAIIYPEQKNLVVKIGSPSQSGRNGILAALTGFPVVTVPAGFSPSTADAPIGVPIGMEILGKPWSESMLINIASHISSLTHIRRIPKFANTSVEVTSYSAVPTVIPNTANIPSAYPVGVY